jgi:hypothetical protein
LDEADWEDRLKFAILSAWRSSEEVRPKLLEAARSQLAASEAAYDRLHHSITPVQFSVAEGSPVGSAGARSLP